MNILLWLIPAALFLGLLGLGAFLWALKSGQFDDLDGAANRILFDDDDDVPAGTIRPAVDGGLAVSPDWRDVRSCEHQVGPAEESAKASEGGRGAALAIAPPRTPGGRTDHSPGNSGSGTPTDRRSASGVGANPGEPTKRAIAVELAKTGADHPIQRFRNDASPRPQ